MSALCATSPYTNVEIAELPTFRPNEYFWNNHQRPGEKKHDTYARVIRDIMSDFSGLRQTDIEIE